MRHPPYNPSPANEFYNTDHCSSHGAQALCRRIEGAWRQAGHHDVRCHPVALRGKDGIVVGYAVRSNLVGALPPSAHRVAA